MAKNLRTIDIARRTGISLNTVRLYESLGYLPDVPRAKNGYRQFNERHFTHVLLTRQAMRCTWLGGAIRQTALSMLTTAAQGDYDTAIQQAQHLCELLHIEHQHAEEAITVLENWVHSAQRSGYGRTYRISQVAERIHASRDEILSWERNGLISIARAENRYRQYTQADIDRLLVIRTLRRAKYSLMAILRLLQHLDNGDTVRLRDVLDTPMPDTLIEPYPTDSWLSTLEGMLEACQNIRKILDELVANPA